jgi:palmitoyltransferase
VGCHQACLPYAVYLRLRLVTHLADSLTTVDYLLNPPNNALVSRRAGAAIAILVIYYVLLFPVLTSYARLIQTIVTNPGYTPRGAQWHQKERRESHRRRHHRGRYSKYKTSEEKERSSATWPGTEYSPRSSNQSSRAFTNNTQPRVEDFWLKEVFISNYDGRPRFCSTCLNFKPDRAHHCSEVDRCVRKMDHFCPWVGGIVSETSVKFFIQFCFYAALFCTHNLVVMAYFYAERRRNTSYLDVHWILALAFAAMFLLFSAGMFASTLQLAVINSTTIENLSRKTKVWYLAVYMPRPEEVMRRRGDNRGTALRTITYPRPPEEQQVLLQQSGNLPVDASTLANPSPVDLPVRTFAILETPAGFNPWDCGPLQNIKEVMGNHLIDWFLPLRHSPCADHSSGVSMFRLGPQVERLKEDAGLVPRKNEVIHQRPTHRRKRRRRKSLVLSDDADANGQASASDDRTPSPPAAQAGQDEA